MENDIDDFVFTHYTCYVRKEDITVVERISE